MSRPKRNLQDVALLYSEYSHDFKEDKKFEVLYTESGKSTYIRKLAVAALIARLATDETFFIQQFEELDGEPSAADLKKRHHLFKRLLSFSCEAEIINRRNEMTRISIDSQITFANVYRKVLLQLVAFPKKRDAEVAQKFWGFKQSALNAKTGKWPNPDDDYDPSFCSLNLDWIVGSTYHSFEEPKEWESILQTSHQIKLDFYSADIDLSDLFTSDTTLNRFEKLKSKLNLRLKDIRQLYGIFSGRTELKIDYAFNVGNDLSNAPVNGELNRYLSPYIQLAESPATTPPVESSDSQIPQPPSSAGQPTFKIFYGPPGTGKTRKAKKKTNAAPDKSKIIQIHPSSSYEDIIEGIRPINFTDGSLKYDVVDGPLKVMARKADGKHFTTLAMFKRDASTDVEIHLPLGTVARYQLRNINIRIGKHQDFYVDQKNISGDVIRISAKTFEDNFPEINKQIIAPTHESKNCFFDRVSIRGNEWGVGNYVLIFDEINRGNVASILGEMIFVISEVDSDSTEKKSVSLQYSHEQFEWPSRLSLIGTMNSCDVSVDRIDQAIKRRFVFEEVGPNYTVFEKELNFSFLTGRTIKEFFERDIAEDGKHPGEILKKINAALTDHAHEYSAFNVEDKLIGQSYFIKFARDIIQAKVANKSGKRSHVGGMLKRMLDQEIKPALLNVFNGNRVLRDEFIEKHLDEWNDKSVFGYPLDKNASVPEEEDQAA